MIPLPSPVQNGRPAEQVAGRYIPIPINGETRRLRVLWINENAAWVEKFHATMNAALQGIGEVESLGDVASALRGRIDDIIGLLVAYDVDGTLGGADFIKGHANDADIWEAFRDGVLRAAFPLAEDLARWAPELRMVVMQALLEEARSSSSTKPAPKSTAGRRRRSKPS